MRKYPARREVGRHGKDRSPALEDAELCGHLELLFYRNEAVSGKSSGCQCDKAVVIGKIFYMVDKTRTVIGL